MEHQPLDCVSPLIDDELMNSTTLAIDCGQPLLPQGPPDWPPRDEQVSRALMQLAEEGGWGQYNGPQVEQLVAALSALHGNLHVYPCCSGTIAVELALRGLQVGPGDEVILAGYDFPGYRAGMRQRKLPRAPVCSWRAGSAFSLFDAAIPLGGLPELPAAFGASVVIEETDGTKSYWALTHASDKPDFHDPACFAGRLAAPEAP